MTGEEKKMEKPLISVIIPIYNCEKWINETIESVLKQTYKELEIIVINDCSTDNSGKIIEEYQKKDSRIKILQNPINKGVADTRNYGISQAKGEYIALLDGDDIWMEEKIEKQLYIAKKKNADIVYCSYGLINEYGENLHRDFLVPEIVSLEEMLKKSVISCSTCFVRGEILKKNMFDKKYYHEDYALWLKLLKDGKTAYGDKNVLAFYRQISGSRSNNKINSAFQRWKIYRELMSFSLIKSMKYFICYAVSGIRKYLL